MDSEQLIPDETLDRLPRDQSSFRAMAEDRLRHWIVTGALAPGTRLNEVELSTKLGISRGPLREAVQRLISDGLVERVAYRGSFVRTWKPAEIRDLYDVRAALEGRAAWLAAERITDGEADLLSQVLRETEDLMSAGDAGYPSHLDLHARLVDLAGNSRLVHYTREVSGLIEVARLSSARQQGRAAEALIEHAEIVQAVVTRNPAEAQRLMVAHIGRSMSSALQHLQLD